MTRKFLLVVPALVATMIGGALSSAKITAEEAGVTCGWCHQYLMDGTTWIHGFNDPEGDRCGFPNPWTNMPGANYCARCGGTSTCHVGMEPATYGECHQACGSGQASVFERPIQEAIDSGEPSAVLVALQSLESGLSAEYSAEGGRIDIIAACDVAEAALTFIVPTEMREELTAAIGSAEESTVRFTR